MKKLLASVSVLFVLPWVAFAAINLQPIADFFTQARGIINTLIGLLMALAVVVFFWGLVRYIWGGGKGEIDHAKGRKVMTAGLTGIFVMASLFGIIWLLQNFLGVYVTGSLNPPSIGGQTGGTSNSGGTGGSQSTPYTPGVYGGWP